MTSKKLVSTLDERVKTAERERTERYALLKRDRDAWVAMSTRLADALQALLADVEKQKQDD